jgi:hypothetical protein
LQYQEENFSDPLYSIVRILVSFPRIREAEFGNKEGTYVYFWLTTVFGMIDKMVIKDKGLGEEPEIYKKLAG